MVRFNLFTFLAMLTGHTQLLNKSTLIYLGNSRFYCIFAKVNYPQRLIVINLVTHVISYITMLNVCKASAGTGKTYTLAAYYISLLLSDENYRSILAVTFTNKATAEMKERIITYLYQLSHDYESPETKAFLATVRQYMVRNHNKSDEELRTYCLSLFKHLIEDMDKMHIMTIDSFLQSVQQGMFTILEDGMDSTMELDIAPLVSKAVDQVITTHMHEYEQIKQPLLNYLREQMDDEKDWDIRKSVIELTSEIFKESVQILQSGKRINLSVEHIVEFKKALLAPNNNLMTCALWTNAICVRQTKELLDVIETYQQDLGKHYQNTIVNTRESLQGKVSHDKFLKGFTDGCTKDLHNGGEKLCKSLLPAKREIVLEQLLKLEELISECKKLHLTLQLTLQPLNNMSIVGAVIEQIQKNLKGDRALLLAETAFRLYSLLQTGDADFILEQSGIRYKHIMIDEAQDTSRLQWNVFEPLISEVVGSGGNVLMVGDAKQSIYRWRNGDWHIMHEAENKYSSKNKQDSLWNLECNFRSKENIVLFTQEVFQYIQRQSTDQDIQYLYQSSYSFEQLNKYYNSTNSGKVGGYVRMLVYRTLNKDSQNKSLLTKNAAEEEILHDMFAQIVERILTLHESPADMLILIRTKKEGEKVLQYFHEHVDEFELDEELQIVSEDNFFLESSTSVQLIIHALRYIYNRDCVAALFLASLGEDSAFESLEHLDSNIPIYQLVHKVVQCYLLQDKTISDLAYVNYFLDQVQTYGLQQGSDLETFLQYWEDQLHSKAIPNFDSHAIRMMTIHKSKGLEGKNVFIPYCTWNSQLSKGKIWCKDAIFQNATDTTYLPVDYNKRLEQSYFCQAYQEEKRLRNIDDLNLLYVAITRAQNSLYLYNLTKDNESIDSVGDIVEQAFIHLSTHAPQLFKCQSLQTHQEYTCGEKIEITQNKTLQKTDKKETYKPFNFNDMPSISNDLVSDGKTIAFRQSQQAYIYRHHDLEKSEEILNRIDIGNICHALLAQIRTLSDIDGAINHFVERGIIDSEEKKIKVRNLIHESWNHLCKEHWFNACYDEVLCEQAFLDDKQELRPDRVMIKGNRVIILDYKFGKQNEKYIDQINKYIHLFKQMGYNDVHGYIWYAQDKMMIKV